MKKSIFFGILVLTILSCKTASVSNTTVVNDTEKLPYFKASGTEPFWSISISEDQIVYKTPEDSIILPYVKPIFAMDSNVKLYRVKTESAEFTIQISQQECQNEMSGELSPYKVSVDYRKNKTSAFENIKGCGQYITDYRLHDIWVLEELNGKIISKEDFSKEFPIMEIYASANKFSGFAGCNRMNGSLFFEKETLRFINITTTEMMCENSNKETEFLKALQSVTIYSIGENRLILSNPSGKKIIFKKID
jgi:heat shock protein HslJ